MVSRADFWSRSRSHSSLVGLDLGLMKCRSRSHGSWSRGLLPRKWVSQLNRPSHLPRNRNSHCMFGRYKVTATQSTTSQDKTLAEVLTNYLQMIGVTEMQLSEVFKMEQFSSICPLLERVLCVPVSSAPVERVFSQSGLVMKPNRARMSDSLLEELVFLKCNDCWMLNVDTHTLALLVQVKVNAVSVD